MRESARGRSSAPTAFTDDKELGDLSVALGGWQTAGDAKRLTDGLFVTRFFENRSAHKTASWL